MNLETIANRMYKLHGLSDVIIEITQEKYPVSQAALEYGDST